MINIKEIVNVDDELCGGTPVFKGSRVFISILFDFLQGSALDEFVEDYPSVSREQASKLLQCAELALNSKVCEAYEMRLPD